MFVGVTKHRRGGWRPNTRAVKERLHWEVALALFSTVFGVERQPGCGVQLWPWSFFLSLVGQAAQFVLPCLAPGSWLYVPSQVPLSLHTRSKKAPLLPREKESNAVSLLCPALPDIFLNVGQQLCELCAVRVVRLCFVWMPVHSRQVLDFCFFGCCLSD